MIKLIQISIILNLLLVISSVALEKMPAKKLTCNFEKKIDNKCSIQIEYESTDKADLIIRGRVKILNSDKVKRILEFAVLSKVLNQKGENNFIYKLISKLDPDDVVIIEIKRKEVYIELIRLTALIRKSEFTLYLAD